MLLVVRLQALKDFVSLVSAGFGNFDFLETAR
jgi:hypothetical protein